MIATYHYKRSDDSTLDDVESVRESVREKVRNSLAAALLSFFAALLYFFAKERKTCSSVVSLTV